MDPKRNGQQPQNPEGSDDELQSCLVVGTLLLLGVCVAFFALWRLLGLVVKGVVTGLQ